MKKTRDRYVSVNGAWPTTRDKLPPLTAHEAKRAFKAMYRHRFHKRWNGFVVAVKGAHRRSWLGEGRAVMGRSLGGAKIVTAIKPQFIVAPDQGWHNFVHDVSHWIHAKQYPSQRAHLGSSHAAVEKDLIELVVNSGWLDGKLKGRERAARPKPDKAAQQRAKLEAALRRWRTKAKRAATGIKKTEARLKRLAKKLAA